MKRNLILILVALSLSLGMAGCFPEDRIVWSPDGRQAVVIAPSGLYVCDAHGTLSAALAENVAAAAWMSDSRSVVVVGTTPAANWNAAAALLSAQRQKQIIDDSAILHREILAQQGLSDLGKLLETSSIPQSDRGDLALMLIYLREHNPQGLPEKIGPEDWKKLEELQATIYTLSVTHLEDGALRFSTVLHKSLYPISELRVSPKGSAVAFVSPEQNAPAVWVVGTEMPGAPQLVATSSDYADWSADGRYLAYIYATTPEVKDHSLRLGALARRAVADEIGRILPQFSPAEDIAGLLYMEGSKVRYLRDGRILFAAADVRLPSTADDMPKNATLFAVKPGTKQPVSRLLSHEAEGEILGLPGLVQRFVLSPDEKKAAIPGANGELIVVDLDTQKVDKLQPDKIDNVPVRIAPVWRGSNQLCYVAPSPAGAAGQSHPQIVLYDFTQGKVLGILSANWPEKVIEGLLARTLATQPASLPASGEAK